MVPLAGTETGAVAIVGKALLWKKQERYGPAGGVLKSMQGKYSYVQTKEIPVLHLELIMISAIGGSCPRAYLDERRDLIEAHIAEVRLTCGKFGVCIIKFFEKSIRLLDCGGPWILIFFLLLFCKGECLYVRGVHSGSKAPCNF